ncbi:MAG: response regulator [Cyanophyceae cyanobacterium]
MCAEDERRILIISSSTDIQRILRLSLEMSVDWSIITVGSVSEGLALAAAAPPHVILLDANLSDIDALTALQTLRNAPATQPSRVIVLASRVRLSQQRQFSQMGAVAVISDPFNSANLAQQIAIALGWL